MGWTEAQQKVIDTRNKNVLVSAAAGSGKTAVLVERIISMISEGEKPMDIDHLLVVTFTNAAAAEMRGRIGKAIEEKLLLEPDNLHLQKQVSLLQSAQITTIHSFCLNVIRNYFHRIDLDPAFKIAEESEITLMKSDVIAQILEAWYEEGSEEFHDFIESYSYSKSDAPVEDLILQLYNFAMSDPWPKKWIAHKQSMFDIHSIEDMSKRPWMKEMLAYIHTVLEDLSGKCSEGIALCNDADGPMAYLPALLSDRSLLERLKSSTTYQEYVESFEVITFDRLSSKKEPKVEQWKKDKVKALREEVKKGIKDLVAQFFFQSPEEMLKDLQAVGRVMKVLFDLTLDFMENFAKKKEEKNLIDFNDLEHFALKILIQEQETGYQITPAALELSEEFDEILIDEYQDSNMVQETILRSISREDLGSPNRFMVGDVKQSIYKFRLAMPEIFMEKYGKYSCEDKMEDGEANLYQRIDLDKNFRSRNAVLMYVNKVFEQIMQKPVGGILYDEAAALKYGELYEDLEDERIASEAEILLVTEEDCCYGEGFKEANQSDTEESGATEGEDLEEAQYTKKEIEARVIAHRIKELTNPLTGMLVFDKKTCQYRPAQNSDIVILLRSMSNWSEVFVNTLMQEGISAYADTGTGYFQTLEIMTILNMLRIIDNPRQDIPLAGVLYSPMGGLTSTDLALIRASARNVSLYVALLTYKEEGNEEELKSKVYAFLDLLEQFRKMVNYKPLHELIQLVLEETGYYYYASALPGGEQRKANIDMLITKAVQFEKGSYTGLFHFIRYIEKLNKYEVDFAEAATTGEQDNTVRIMSIHKSKGLEFPICIVAGMSKQFNTQDLRSKIVLHSELGIGPEYVDSTNRTKVSTLVKKVIQKKVQIENLGEELRVLYVAMTRAKEKLILTGYLKSLEEIKEKSFSFFELLSAKSYLDWVLPATINKVGWSPKEEKGTLVSHGEGVSVRVFPKSTLLKEEVTKQTFLRKDKEELLSIDPDTVYDQNLKEEIEARLNYAYPFAKEANLKIKMTVSELKKLGQFIDEEESLNLYEKSERRTETNRQAEDSGDVDANIVDIDTVGRDIEDKDKVDKDKVDKDKIDRDKVDRDKVNSIVEKSLDFIATVPNFISQKQIDLSGTDRGTLYHKVLELIDLLRLNNDEDVTNELKRLVEDGRIKEKDLKLLNINYIKKFVQSDVVKRMRNAALIHKLYKEKQFVMGIKASEIARDVDSDELILIQGIIDVFFEEEGELVLLDYKSDFGVGEEELIKRYKVQLNYYRKALEQMLGKRVKEMIIYSLPLGKSIGIVDERLGTL